MRVVRDLKPGKLAQASVVTIGNFDGLHLGHQTLISKVKAEAGSARTSAIVCFEPLPQAYFNPDHAPAKLQSPGSKLKQLRRMGLDLVWMMRFNSLLASMPPDEFAGHVLKDTLQAKTIIVGEDFRFGRGREGNVASLQRLGENRGFSVESIAAVNLNGGRVSSSAIREMLAKGDFSSAAELLGRPYRFCGRVIPGQRLGRKLGFATANIRIKNQPCPIMGVLAVNCEFQGRTGVFPGVASLGVRPAVGGGELLLEVHLFGFNQNLYHQHITVEPVAKLRDEQHFESLEDMVVQMEEDAREAKRILGSGNL